MMSGWRRLMAGGVGTTLTLLLAVTPAASLAQSVSNSHGSNIVAQVVWSESYDVTTDIGRFGGIAGDIEDQGAIVSLWDVDNRAISCADGTQGIAATYRDGDGPGTVTIASNLGSAVVAGVLTITTATYDYCTNTYTKVSEETGVTVRLELVATTKAAAEPWKYHDLVRGEYNAHGNVRSTSREATGTALLGGLPYHYDFGLISHNTWSDHYNSH
jgi:hypothetical protein